MARTISSALRWWALETPDYRAVSVGGDSITYQALDTWVTQVAANLVEAGIEPGDRVGSIAGSSIAHCALLLGAIRAGAIVAPVNIRLAARETAEYLALTQPKLVFGDEDQADKFAIVESSGSAARPMADVTAWRDVAVSFSEPERGAEDAVGIISTSGSTGRPKGVTFTHASMLGYAQEFAVSEPFQGPGSSALVLSPLSTSGGFVQLIEFISLGATVFFELGFDPARALELLERERVVVFMGVPLFFEAIAACPGFDAADLSALKVTVVGGARVPLQLLQVWSEKGCILRQIYGQTEAGGSVTIMSKRDAARKPECAGRGNIFTDVGVIDESGNALGPNEPGQIVLRGPSVMAGYWNNPEETDKTLVDGWLRTGDLGSVDDEGYLRFIDRIKDIIISGGLNISAAEIERVVAEFPGVREVAVLGAKDEKFGETPLAVVYAEAALDVPALIEHCNQHLADYKVPRYVVPLDGPLPRLATGKIAKPQLRSEFLPKVPEMTRVR